MELTDKEKQIIFQAFELLQQSYKDRENTIREFKYLCKVPQFGDEYIKNINVFELQDKAIKGLKEDSKFALSLLGKLLKQI